ncbi:phytochelatin synthase family protein [Hyphomonas sp.]|uniref:phytochelatin synthase family protein n=1 Tax=Hyphomonas sp. TaxID=87 RepID=UPI003526EE67
MTNQKMTTRLAAAGLSLLMCACTAIAEGPPPAPKLSETATPVTEDTEYLRTAPAPDYWAFAPFVKPQFTNSACSIASVTGVVNGLRGLPVLAKDSVTTQPGMLEITGEPVWASVSAEGGDGVTFDQLVAFTEAALAANDLAGYQTEVFHPAAANEAALDQMRAMLVANEVSAEDALLVYFNQGVVTGDWDGPHVSVIGAYDAEKDRVLVLEVDQEWYIPYWTPAETLLAAMVKPTSAEHGVLEGQTGGFVHVYK